MPGCLVVLGGLPGVGKTTIAREAAQRLGAMHLRIDTIEMALWRAHPELDMTIEGYVIAYGVAEDNLRLGCTVIADSVNPVGATREGWLDAARGAGAVAHEVEIVCSDADQHRRRVETRVVDIADLTPPTWAEVEARPYQSWTTPALRIDTATTSPAEAAARIAALVTG